MSESAFGIEHGDVSKAFNFKIPKLPKPGPAGGARKAPGGTVSPISNFAAGAKAGLKGGGAAPFKGAAQRGAQMGAGARKVGMNRGVQMGAAAGAGGYGGSQMNRNKRMPQYR